MKLLYMCLFCEALQPVLWHSVAVCVTRSCNQIDGLQLLQHGMWGVRLMAGADKGGDTKVPDKTLFQNDRSV